LWSLQLYSVKDNLTLRFLGGISPKRGTPLMCISLDMDACENVLAVCQAAAKVPIQTLYFCGVHFPGPKFAALVSAIPHIQAQKTDVFIRCDEDTHVDDDAKAQILDAVMQNFGIAATCKMGDLEAVDVFDDADHKRLEFLYDRNKRHADWKQNPDTVPQELWYEALGVSLEASRESIYHSLHQVASKDFFARKQCGS